MRKTIMIGDVPVPVMATGATRYKYESYFGREIHDDLLNTAGKVQNAKTDIEQAKAYFRFTKVVDRLLYIMAKEADPSISDDMLEWIGTFGPLPYEDFANEVVNFFLSSTKPTLKPKNV